MNYKLTIIPALELTPKSIEFHYETAEQMLAAKNTVADLLLFIQDDIKAMKDYSNMFFMAECIDDEWEDYEDYEESDGE